MNELYLSLLWLAGSGWITQIATMPRTGGADPAAAAAGGAPAGAAPAADPMSGLWTFLPMMLGVMLIFMLISNRPQQKESARLKKLLGDLKKNDRVVTAGGIVGSVVTASGDSPYITIRIDESTNAKMQVLKQSIVRVIEEENSRPSAS